MIENKQIDIHKMFSIISDWIDLSGQKGRYFSASPFTKENCNISWGLEIKDILTLIWSKELEVIYYIKGREYTSERLQFWVYHTFAPILFELRSMYHILHVGSVEIEGKPVLFSAPSFGGKSTMTDYFIKQGHTMLSDDAMAIEKVDGVYWAIASYPFHRPYRKPEVLGYFVKNFATELKPLHAVYLLEKNKPDAGVQIIELKGIEKFKAFHDSSFINFDFMKKERFIFFTEMAQCIPVYKIIVPFDFARLDEVYARIVMHSKSIV